MGNLLALGYEGPATLGDLVAALAIFVGIVVVALFVIRWLLSLSGGQRKGRGPFTGRRR